ncbi:MAG: hypothetical protein A2283_22815 [Lentisphaerae bacterium RIFOXYA12_FULL_48_11]|nr:MAG: hypothetical protein A2283_22815 [Lentisphaerae bacterium RIFOXYA12_FULL_48_11]
MRILSVIIATTFIIQTAHGQLGESSAYFKKAYGKPVSTVEYKEYQGKDWDVSVTFTNGVATHFEYYRIKRREGCTNILDLIPEKKVTELLSINDPNNVGWEKTNFNYRGTFWRRKDDKVEAILRDGFMLGMSVSGPLSFIIPQKEITGLTNQTELILNKITIPEVEFVETRITDIVAFLDDAIRKYSKNEEANQITIALAPETKKELSELKRNISDNEGYVDGVYSFSGSYMSVLEAVQYLQLLAGLERTIEGKQLILSRRKERASNKGKERIR